MNKNNTSIPNPSQASPHKSKNYDCEGRSEFTRHKLQREYQPKLVFHKHKLPKTTEQERDAQLRLERQKEEELVASNALECFKKGELINIDWKTKTNFRKSQCSRKLPRLKTQTLQLKNLNHSNRSNTYQKRQSKSLKSKDIEQKRLKLKQLLYPKKTGRFSKRQNTLTENEEALYENTSSILSESKYRKMMGNAVVNRQLQGQSENFNTFLNEQRLMPDNDMINFATLRSQTEEMKRFGHSSQHLLQKSQRLPPQQKDNQSRLPVKTISSPNPSLIEITSSKNHDSTSVNQELHLAQGIISAQKKELSKAQQNYDILNDPEIYLLISKSRERIISWKESCILECMSQIERLKLQQETQKKSSLLERDGLKERAKSMDNGLGQKNIEKHKMMEKIEDRKRINSEKLSKKLTTRVITETQEFLRQSSLRNSANHSQIYSYLGMKSPERSEQKLPVLFRPKQSLIRQRKKESLIEVQQKLLKKVKLSFLKEDLTKKFEQIRTEQQGSELRH